MFVRSVHYKCDVCGPISTLLLPVTDKSNETREEMRELAAQLSMSAADKDSKSPDKSGDAATKESEEQAPEPETEKPETQDVNRTDEEDRGSPLSTADRDADATTPNTQASPTVTTPPQPRLRPGTVRRPEPADTQHTPDRVNRSRTCLDSVTLYAMILIAVMIAALVLRRAVVDNWMGSS